MRPWRMTKRRSLTVIASSWSCVTSRKVLPSRRCSGAQFELHLGPQLGVEGGHRLVQQQQVRLVDEGAGQGHALLLAAGELLRAALAHVGELEHLQGGVHAAGHLRRGRTRRLRRPKATFS